MDHSRDKRRLRLPKVERRLKSPTQPTVHEKLQEVNASYKNFQENESIQRVKDLFDELLPKIREAEKEEMLATLEDALEKLGRLKNELDSDITNQPEAHQMVDNAINVLEEQRNKIILPLLHVEPKENPSNFMETNFDDVKNELIDDIGEEASWVDTLSHQEAWDLLQERKRAANNTLPEQPEPQDEVVENIPPNETPDQGLDRTRAAYLRILNNPPKEKALTNRLSGGKEYRRALAEHAQRLEKAKEAYNEFRDQVMDRKIKDIESKTNDPEEQRKQALAYFIELQAQMRPEQGKLGSILSKTENFFTENDVRDGHGNIDEKKTRYKRIAKVGLSSLMTLASTAALGINHRTLGEGATRALEASFMAGIVTSESAQKLIRDKIEQFKKLSQLQKYAIVGAGAIVGTIVATQVAGISATSVAISGVGSLVRYAASKGREYLLKDTEKYVQSLDIKKLSANYEALEKDLKEIAEARRQINWLNFVVGTATSLITAKASALNASDHEPILSNEPETPETIAPETEELDLSTTQDSSAQVPETIDSTISLPPTGIPQDTLTPSVPFQPHSTETPATTPYTLPETEATQPENPIQKPETKEIAGMDAKYVVDQEKGVTHAFKEQVDADPELGKKLKEQIGYTGKVGTKAFYKALGQKFGYIDENGEEIRVKWDGKEGMAAYQIIKGMNGQYRVIESHMKDGDWERVEDHNMDQDFEGKNYEKEYEYYKNGHVSDASGEPTPSESGGPVETPTARPESVSSIPTERPIIRPLDVEDYGPATHQEAPRREIVIDRPVGNGTVRAGYVTGGDYLTGVHRGVAVERLEFSPGEREFNALRNYAHEQGYNFSEAQLHNIDNLYKNNIDEIFRHSDIWSGPRGLQHGLAADTMKETGYAGSGASDRDFFVNFMHELRNATGLKPRGSGWLSFREPETNERYMIRALLEAERQGKLHQLDIHSGHGYHERGQNAIETNKTVSATEEIIENSKGKIDFGEKNMSDLWLKYEETPDSLNYEERAFALKVDKLRKALGSERPSIRNDETAERYLNKLEKATGKN